MVHSSAGRAKQSHLYWHLIFFGLVLGILFLLIAELKEVLTPVVAALILSYLLDPLVSKMEARFRLPRWLGAMLLFLLALVVVCAVVLLIVPVIVREIHSLAEAFPNYMLKIRQAVVPWVERKFKVTIPGSLSELADKFGADFNTLVAKALAPIGSMAGRVAGGAATVLSSLGTLLLIPIFTFYFLLRFPTILRRAEELIPRRYLCWVRETAREVDRVLAVWIRGQMTVMTILALYYAVGLSIAGIKLAVLIGVLTGLLSFIPYVGVVVGLTLAMLVSFLEYQGLGQIIGVASVFALAQLLEGLALSPVLVGEKVGLGPLGVLLALMLGGHLIGFIGILLAVPIAAALVVVLKRAILAYKSTLYFQKGGSS